MARSKSRVESREKRKSAKPKPDKKMDLSSVPGFERPMSAGPGDKYIGPGEMGDVYETVTGQRYTVYPKEDQRTDLAKAKDWWNEGAKLPSGEQIMEALKGIPGAVTQSAEDTVQGRASLGEAMGFVPAIGAAGATQKVPQGSLRIFGGMNAENPPDIPLNYSSAKSVTETMADSGWTQGADGQFRFEISDNEAVIVPPQGKTGKGTLADYLVHDELFRQYPDLKELKVSFEPLEDSLYGSYSGDTIRINSKLPKEKQLDTLLHEVQHWVQDAEGFAPGGNIIQSMFDDPFWREHETPEAKAAWGQYEKDLRSSIKEINDKYSQLEKDILDKLALTFAQGDESLAKKLSLRDPKTWDTVAKEQGVYTSVDNLMALISAQILAPKMGGTFGLRDDGRLSPAQGASRIASALTDAYENDWPAFKDYFDKLNEDDLKNLYNADLFATKLLDIKLPKQPLFLTGKEDSVKKGDITYRRIMGEEEARNVEKRRKLTPEERKVTPPESTEDYPRSMQWDTRKHSRFAEGGVVKPLEQQMQFNFMKGGPVETDPVSGNEVPPGGTPEGVRDDIPAKVSEGEFIFPENVVRFYGIDKLEKMIQKANETLAQMEDAGRMGNPDEAEEEQLPFDVSELQTAEDEGPIQMAAGGPVLTAQPGGGYQQVQYVNANGDKRLVILYNGVPINGMIPAGYFPDTPENRKSLQQNTDQQEDPSVKAVSRNTDFMENRNDSNQGTKAKPVGEWTTEDFENMVTQQKTVDLISKGLGLAGGPAGLAAGLALKGVNNLTQRQAREEILNRINNPETPQEAKDRLNAVYQKLEEPEEEEGGIFGGEGLLGDLFGGDGLLGGIFKSSRTSTDPKNTSGPKSPSTASTGSGYRTSSSPIVSPRPASRSSGSGDFGENRGGPSSSRSENVQASSSWSGSGSGGRTNVSSSFRDTYGSADTASRNSSDYSTGVGDREDKTTSGGLSFGFKKGGLVTRRKK